MLHRKLWTGLMALALLVTAVLPAAAQEQAEDKRARLGIGPIEVIPSLRQQVQQAGKHLLLGRITEALEPQLIDRLHNTRAFVVVARNDLKALMVEQNLTPLLDSETAPQAFKVRGLTHLVMVSIDHFEDRTERLHLPQLGREAVRRTIVVSAVAKLWDTTSGELKESTNFQLGSNDEDLNLPQDLRQNLQSTGVQGEGEALDRLLAVMGRTMAHKVANRVVDVVYPARVVAVQNKVVYISRGDGTDITRGQNWVVYALGPEMIHPDLGISLGRSEVPIGKVRVTEVRPQFSMAQVVEDMGIEAGQVLRPEDVKDQPH